MAGPASSSMASESSTPSFESMSRRIVECLRQRRKHLVGVCGWDGVGRERVMRHAVEALQTGSDGRPNPFTRILWLSQGEASGIGDMIYKKVRAERDAEGEPFRFWNEPFSSPQYRLLVVAYDLQQAINLQRVSKGYYPAYYWPVQIVFSGDPDLVKSLETSREIWALDSSSTDAACISESFAHLSEEEAIDLLWQESDAVADELHREYEVQDFTRDAIMECFFYMTLFPRNFLAPMYWESEGLLHSSSEQSPNFGKDIITVDLLIASLVKRNMVVELPGEKGQVQIATPLVKKVRAITTATHLSPSLTTKRKGRFLVEISAGLKEAPAMERWDQEDITRVSLADNNIERLQLLPCYHNNIPGDSRGGRNGGENIFSALPSPKCLNLSTLILANNPHLWEIEDDFFKWTPNLRVLDLQSTGLLTLPSSLTCLTNLRFLSLENCSKLETMSPCLEKGFQNLEALDLESCPLPCMKTASLQQVRNLRRLYLDGDSFQNLELLDISGTKIEFLPLVSRVTSLTQLDLLNTKYLSFVDWNALTSLPAVINWDQCGSGTLLPKIGGPRISIKDAHIFTHLSYDSPLWTQCFREFYISISPYAEQQKVIKPTHSQMKHPAFPYTDIIPQIERCHHHRFCPIEHSKRHLQIYGGTSPFTSQMSGVLPHVESLHLSDHETVKNIPVNYPMKLRQCQVLKCRKIETIFHGKPDSILANLQDIRLFHLTRLRTLYEGEFGPESFTRLKQVYLDSCPRIVTIFSSPHIVLEQLQVLVIKLCGTLSEVFGGGAVGDKIAPALRELYLWDLQELKNICNGCLPSLRMLKLRGCAKLRTLPLPSVDSQGNPVKLEITAEYKWWENLNEANKEHINFKGWSPWTLS